MAKGQRVITNIQIFNAKTITKNTSVYSMIVDLRSIAAEGFFSLQYEITGSGVVTLEYQLCNQDSATDFLEPSSATNIGSSLSATTGPGADGLDILPFSPELARFLKIKATETGTAADAVITAWLAVA